MSKRILVVEDQLDNRQIIRDMLAPTDYEITEAENGEEALAAIASGAKSSGLGMTLDFYRRHLPSAAAKPSQAKPERCSPQSAAPRRALVSIASGVSGVCKGLPETVRATGSGCKSLGCHQSHSDSRPRMCGIGSPSTRLFRGL
jgi:CheY-like chemotaxis protein